MGRAGALAVVVAGLASLALGAQQTGVFRAGTQTVPVYATVLEDGRLVTDLTRDDFEILDNGRPQKITLFDSSIQPITIVVMLDMSGSMAGNIGLLRASAVQIFTRLLSTDKARVGNFGDRITLSPKFTNDQNELIRSLWLDLQPGGPTPLWAAVNVAMSALGSLEGRRVVLVLSDGKDTGTRGARGFGRGVTPMRSMFPDVVERAQTEDFMIYAIGMASRGEGRWAGGLGAEPDPGLRILAAESGGGYFEITENTALGPTFTRVADELHRQYLLGFIVPEQDGRPHLVDVRVNRPGLAVRARRSYMAPRGGGAR
jgi:Ca-activated chloride channel homolog